MYFSNHAVKNVLDISVTLSTYALYGQFPLIPPGVLRALKRISRAIHPDKGGWLQDQERLHFARDAWEEVRPEQSAQGGRSTLGAASPRTK